MRFRAVAAAVLLVALAAGCGEREPAPASPTLPPASSSPLRVQPDNGAGADGLTVRYLDSDGTIKTLPAEDFHR